MKIDLSLPEFVSLYTSVIDQIVKYHIPDTYRICISILPNSTADISIYPSASDSAEAL